MKKENSKNQTKIKVINLIAVFIVLVLIYALIFASYIIKQIDENNKELYKKNQNRAEISEKIEKNNELEIEDVKEKNKLNGEYSYNEFNTEENLDSIMEVVSYDKYIETIDKINNISTEKIKNKYTDNNVNYVILAYAKKDYYYGFDLSKCIEKTDEIVVSGFEIIESKKDNGRGYFIAIPTEKAVGTKIKYEEKYTLKKPEEEKTKNRMVVIEKPIIYLYPIKEEKINVKLLNENLITHSYPKYNNKWEVLAKPNGDLIDLKTGRNLYSLYYESIAMNDLKMNNEGFIVKGENSINFLEEKLKILGLTEREAEEFIIYWLPKLESNKYNYIRFATNDELDKIMPIEINPNPDTFIRINMIFKGLEEPINIREQKLQTPKREGFVAVEWGGTEIK